MIFKVSQSGLGGSRIVFQSKWNLEISMMGQPRHGD